VSGLSDIFSRAVHLFGGPTVTKADIPPLQGQPYPDQSQVESARANDASYGDLAAAFVQPPYGGRVASPRGAQQIIDAFNRLEDTRNLGVTPDAVTSDVADNLMAGYLASRRSALAGLGFDPRHMAISHPPEQRLNIAGEYDPQSDQILTSGGYPSTTVHESMHRGVEQLRQAGLLPEEANKMSEEAIIRGQMLRNYGNVELGRGTTGDRQIEDGRYYNENRNFAPTMDAIEVAAQKLYAQRHPRGPR
jgi:hypothetical protein